MNLERCFFLIWLYLLLLDLTILHIPKTVIWEKYIPQGSDEWDFQVAVCKFFEERPIWPKESLVERMLDMGFVFRHVVFRRFWPPWYFLLSSIDKNLCGLPQKKKKELVCSCWHYFFILCRLLSRIAYYFSSGPFQRFWIKKGYDPRNDRDSRMWAFCLNNSSFLYFNIFLSFPWIIVCI